MGINESEKYLAKLCEKTFLSLWSYPNVYYKKGKEFADLLVIFGNEVIIFQDKSYKFPPTASTLEEGWRRWSQHTIVRGIEQVRGAERRLRNQSTQLYIDSKCENLLPIPLPNYNEIVIHLVVVTHGGAAKCKEALGGSGSLMLSNRDHGVHNLPFLVCDVDKSRTFTHVLDDNSLEILLDNLDTVADFTLYLTKKEQLFRSDRGLFAAGEEELLANYLSNMKEGEHDFSFSSDEMVESVAIVEGFWEKFSENPQRKAQLNRDEISYLWDSLLESVFQYLLDGTLHADSGFQKDIQAVETITRFMARESRFGRRVLALTLKDLLDNTHRNKMAIRVIRSPMYSETLFVYLLLPMPEDPNISYVEYREARATLLEGACLVSKKIYPEVLHIVGIAMEPYVDGVGSSEDFAYLDLREWSNEQESRATKFQEQLGILTNTTKIGFNESEYPNVA